ncbi:MAG: multicopper oxidase domain-containing protein [Burkholderiaceae bacterium]
MLNRRNVFNLGLLGSASTLLGLPTLPRAAGGATAPRRVLTPFLDPLPFPPAPRELPFTPGNVPLVGLAEEVKPFVDASQTKGKVGFYRIVSEVRSVKFHSQLPATEIWGYSDGNLPAGQSWNYALGPTFTRPLASTPYSGTVVRHENKLPSAQDHVGFGEPRTTVHMHGGHHPARSDGYPVDTPLLGGKVTFARNEHFDYVYPLLDPGDLDDLNGDTTPRRDPTERPSTLWYHDHILDFTAQNVYRGLAGFFLVFDNAREPDPALRKHVRDIGNETMAPTADMPNLLQLPSNNTTDGSYDYDKTFDIPMVVQEKTFGPNGELVYDVFNQDGFLGEQYLVNGMVQPYLPVKRRKYRFRFLNGSNARIYQLFLVDKNGRSYPMTQIATEGGLLSRALVRPSFMLSMAERVEMVIDFSAFPYPQFSELYLENRLVQVDGRGPKGTFEKPELAPRGTQILKFQLGAAVADPSRVPQSLRPFSPIEAEKLSGAPIRNFLFERRNGLWVINGQVAGDLGVAVATPTSGRGEIWRFINKSGGWWHPIHVHSEYMRVIKRNGKAPFDGTGVDLGQSVERDGLAKKDTIVLGPNSEVEVFVEFRDFKGPWVFHCHNIEHEDHAMMARFDVK